MANPSERSIKATKPITKGVRGLLRGQIGIATAAREAFRRGRANAAGRRERLRLDELAGRPAALHPNFASLSSAQLLEHFRNRETPSFPPAFQFIDKTAAAQRARLPAETEELLQAAKLVLEHRWPLLGFGEKNFGPEINWLRDPLSDRVWSDDYHRDVELWHHDGSDIRVLWELNRLGHFVTLARAYAVTHDESFASEFFEQLDSWQKQNPLGRGPNWTCAMEVALRSINLLNAFAIFRKSSHLTEARLLVLLQLFAQHAEHILRNLEFSYVSTSNHYLSDVVGVLWLGVLLPELRAAADWREWALKEFSKEIDKQILEEGADYEGSTSYHAFVLELLLVTLVLLETNEIRSVRNHRNQLRAMLTYLQTVLRPDGSLPLVGDVDGSRLLPIGRRQANERAYLSALGSVFFKDATLKGIGSNAEEVLWLFGEEGLTVYDRLAQSDERSSCAFPQIGTYVMRQEDLYLVFSACVAADNRPSSHRHNDLLSIEVSAGGQQFIVDPGAFVYTADLRERNLFRSTAYHSTIMIDDVEQQTIHEEQPFAIGREAKVKVISWASSTDRDYVVAEHTGYTRLSQPVMHRRSITFDKAQRWWFIEDQISGAGLHKIETRFHFDSGLNVAVDGPSVIAKAEKGLMLCLYAFDVNPSATLEPQFTSTDYGAKQVSTTACWTTTSPVPVKLRWGIVPVRLTEKLEERLSNFKKRSMTDDN